MESTTESHIQNADISVEFESYEELISNYKDLNRQNFSRWRKIKHYGEKISEKLNNTGLLQLLNKKNKLKTTFYGKGNSDIKLKYDGVPFVTVGRQLLHCQFGPDIDLTTKERRRKIKEEQLKVDHPVPQKSYFLDQVTKKQNCPATSQMLYIIKLMDYKMEKQTPYAQRLMRTKYQQDLKDYSDGTKNMEDLNLAARRTKIDPAVKERVCDLVADGVSSLAEAKRHIKSFVKRECSTFASEKDSECRTWNPSSRDYNNMMYRAKKSLEKSDDDQENLLEHCKEWLDEEKGDRYFLREGKKDEKLGKILFVMQTGWQRRLQELYGNEITLMDATYGTSKYGLPLFFVCVKTNTRYLVTGTFIIQNEDTSSIEEALSILKTWNPLWRPKYFMTDFCKAEINALENTFPDSDVILCNFHREKDWRQYISKKDNGLYEHKDEILKLLRDIAMSNSEDQFKYNTEKLKRSEVWTDNKSFQHYYMNQWEKEAKRWVQCYRKNCLDIHTNNGVERQNEWLKHTFLVGHKNCNLTNLVDVVLNDFFAASYKEYRLENYERTAGTKKYSSRIPKFLHNRPKYFVKHFMDIIERCQIDVSKIVQKTSCIFEVPSETIDGVKYTTSLGNDAMETYPSCTCAAWERNKLPCKHMIIIIMKFKNMSWASMCFLYRKNPRFVLDTQLVGSEYSIFEKNVTSSISTFGEHPLDLNDEEFINRNEEKDDVQNITKKSSNDDVGTARNKALEMLKSLKTALYQSQNQQAMLNCIGNWDIDLSNLRSSVPKENHLPLRNKVSAPKQTTMKKNVNNYLPKRKNKDLQRGRVGKTADMLRAAKLIKIDEKSDDDDFQTSTFTKIKKTKQINKLADPSKNIQLISQSDLALLDSSSSWLHDKHINATMKLLKKQFPHVHGLIDLFSPVVALRKTVSKHVQILHVDNNHWITCAVINNMVQVYDSLNGNPTEDSVKKLRIIYSNFKEKDDSLPVCFIRNQKQIGSSDCGLFAVANATALCAGGMMNFFKQPAMRLHLKTCLETHLLKDFPSSARPAFHTVLFKKLFI